MTRYLRLSAVVVRGLAPVRRRSRRKTWRL